MLFHRPLTVRLIIHAVLAVGAVIFALPFLWMMATSFMVDKEVIRNAGVNLLPSRPTPRDVSPYIDSRQWDGMTRPNELTLSTWEEWRPRIREHMRVKLASFPVAYPTDVDRKDAEEECIEGAWEEIRRRIPPDQYLKGDLAPILARIDGDFTPVFAQETLDRSHRVFAVSHIQFVRQKDRRQFRLTQDYTLEQLSNLWRVESGPVKLTPGEKRGDRFIEAHYDFTRGDQFALIADVQAPPETGDLLEDLKALKVSFRHDETWHRLLVQVEMRGRLYEVVKPTYLGLDVWADQIVQPPSAEDDDPIRIKLWTVMKLVDSDSKYDHGRDGIRVRVIVKKSSQFHAGYGKAVRNYQIAAQNVPFWRYAATSTVLVILNIVLALLSCSLVAYAFARLQWPGRDVLFLVLLGTLMIPGQVTMIPGFVIIKHLGWYNTLTPLWAFAAFGNAFNIFLLRQFMKGIPRDLEEAARIDGCGFLRIYWHVMLPLVKPTLAAIAIFTFLGSWNDFMGPLIYVNDQRLYPLSLGLFALTTIVPGLPMSVLMAGSVVMTLPIIAIFFFAQKYFIQGVTLTGIKG